MHGLVLSNLKDILSNGIRNISRAVTESIQLIKMFSKCQAFQQTYSRDNRSRGSEATHSNAMFIVFPCKKVENRGS